MMMSDNKYDTEIPMEPLEETGEAGEEAAAAEALLVGSDKHQNDVTAENGAETSTASQQRRAKKKTKADSSYADSDSQDMSELFTKKEVLFCILGGITLVVGLIMIIVSTWQLRAGCHCTCNVEDPFQEEHALLHAQNTKQSNASQSNTAPSTIKPNYSRLAGDQIQTTNQPVTNESKTTTIIPIDNKNEKTKTDDIVSTTTTPLIVTKANQTDVETEETSSGDEQDQPVTEIPSENTTNQILDESTS
ncbi:uncharacterized protein LOC106164457 [Lingula anatina]|uniref:Uncharacterized protein LOC106164457 n=1 Tax=Lingula anatina TaxID=7574 RepID=A0A1S3IHY5_LINAN|nr:uncharacterized protein LOC106164457 [Lingula anatina]|eukprot:XP_013397827.1 uncharacterized protein LOC106164457 [Lingula anatina]